MSVRVNGSFEMLNLSSTLNNVMLFSLVVPNRKGNRKICLGLKLIWKRPSGKTRFPLGTSYFCPGSDWSLILWCNKTHPDEINCMWPWWMTFVKSPIEKFITNQLVNSFTISAHLCFCRCFFFSTQFKGKISQLVGCCLSRRAVSFWCPQGTYAVLSDSPLENAALVYVKLSFFSAVTAIGLILCLANLLCHSSSGFGVSHSVFLHQISSIIQGEIHHKRQRDTNSSAE